MNKLLTVAKAAVKIAEAIKEDAEARYGLEKPFVAHYAGPGVGLVGREEFRTGSIEIGVLRLTFPGPDEATVEIAPFPADADLWNGPNLIPNDWHDGSLEASLVHDVVWSYSEAIGKQAGTSPEAVRRWADGLLVATWKRFGKPGPLTWLKTRIAYLLCPVGSWLKAHGLRIPAVLVAFGVASAAFGYGCSTPPPDWHLDEDTPEPAYVAATAGEVAE